MQRIQRNITINDQQREFITKNHDKMNMKELSIMLGLSYSKTKNNVVLMGLYKPKYAEAPVVQMEGYFDIDTFQKQFYNY